MVVVDVGGRGVVVVVLGSVGLRGAWVDEWVHFGTHTEGVEVDEVEDVEFCHEGGCVG